MLAIYSTLGLARTLAAEQRDMGLGAGLFLVCCLLVVATALTQGVSAHEFLKEFERGSVQVAF